MLFAQLAPLLALAISGAFVLLCWGLVWVRLYYQSRFRPEFAILTILPYAIYAISKTADASYMEVFQSSTWQNIYFVLWIAAGYIAAGSMRLRPDEKPADQQRDMTGIIMYTLIAAYCVSAWITTSFQIFTLNN